MGTESEKLLLVRAMFGLFGERSARSVAPPGFDPSVVRQLAKVRRVVIVGPSGAGKSTLLRLIEREHRSGGARVVGLARLRRWVRVIDRVPGDVDASLRRLASAGLADATLLERLPNELSEGQRVRLRLAVAMARLERPGRRGVLMLDEFGSSLDHVTAEGVASSVARWSAREGVRIAVATNFGWLVRVFDADAEVGLDLVGRTRLKGRAFQEPRSGECGGG